MNKTVRNVFIASLISASIVSSAVFASPVAAQSVGDLQKQIQELLAKVAVLQEQLRVALLHQDQGTSSDLTVAALPRVCKLLPPRGLALGARGEEVTGLQDFLRAEGYLNAEASGYFGSLTRDALARWQVSEGFQAAGVIGPLTLERIRARCQDAQRFSAYPVRGVAPLSVTFNTWLSGFRVQGISYTIDFGDGSSERAADCPAPADACTGPGQNTHVYEKDGTYIATLNKVTDPCAGQPACRAAVHSEVVAKLQVRVGPVACTKEYVPVCGAKPVVCITAPCNPIPTTYGNQCMMEADGASFLYSGQCLADTQDPAADPRCRAWYDGCNTCSRSRLDGPAICTLRACTPESMTKPYCTRYFDDSNTNRPPSISAFSGPTTLAVSETGTWTIRASDPENQTLSYSVSWGDETAAGLSNSSVPVRDSFVQTTTFTHRYERAGTYTVSIIVRDATGAEASTSASVRVGVQTTVCTADAMLCPDGTYVGRTGPGCQFVCPGN